MNRIEQEKRHEELGKLMIDGGLREKAIKTLVRCLSATQPRYDRVTKSYVMEDDIGTQMKAAKALRDYTGRKYIPAAMRKKKGKAK